MTQLENLLGQYLAMRRGFGYDLSTTQRVLNRFVTFAAEECVGFINTAVFLKWQKSFGVANDRTWSARLGMVRAFATWLQAIDPRNEVPPSGLIVGRKHRPRPFIYSSVQIVQIVATAARLPSAYGLRGLTCSTILGLISVSGLRVSEAVGLDENDVDLAEGVLIIRKGKNGKSRVLPIASSTAERLEYYRHERNRVGDRSMEAYFQFETGHRPTDCGIRYNFAHVCQQIGLREPIDCHKHGTGPRIHDLRHTFAVRSMIAWYRDGLDPNREMPKLSAYLGHSNPENTYWYMEAVPELMQLASERAENIQKAGGRQ